MPDSILVVEYEPRYTDRVKQALAGQPIATSFAKDGEEALRVIAVEQPRLIVLSSVVPKVSAQELIRAIRGEKKLQATPILLTVSGYSGTTPKSDAERLGASDILPKPYSESEFLGKVQQMLGVNGAGAQPDPAFMVRPSGDAAAPGLTSSQLFGDLTDDQASAPREPKKANRASAEVDRMLAETLAGVMPQKKRDSGPIGTKPGTPKPKTQSGNLELDKLMEDTRSGLEKNARAARPAAPAAKPAEPSMPPPVPAPVASAAKATPLPTEDAFAGDEPPTMISKQIVVVPTPPPAPAPPAEEEEPTDGIRFGQYVLLEKIATGGMAEVWRARMRGVEGFQKIVAIKKILPHLSDNQDFVDMFIDEAKLAAQLSHTNIVHIFDLGRIQSSYFIAMEYVEGFDLKTILKRAELRDQPMQVELALFIASKIAAALDYAHRKRDFENRDLGLVHRDVSPQNVLISEEGDIKLCDFGIAKAASKASHTQAGALKGKLQYMSPEQASGQAIDRRSDIFSLSAVLFEMLTRRKLFAGDSEMSILDSVREARVTAPSLFNDEVTPEIDAVVLKALNKDPDRRYQTAAEMARDIDQILYSYKPTPTSADLAIYMHRLATPESVMPHVEPPVEEVDTEVATMPAPKPAAVVPAPAPPLPVAVHAAPVPAPAAPLHVQSAPVVEPLKKSPVAAIVAAVVVLGLIGGGWFLMRGKSAAPAPAAATTASPSASSSAAAPSNVPAATPAATQTTVAAAATQTAIDEAKVDAEVRKRLEAERLKLDQQSQKTDAAKAPTTRPAQSAPVTAAPAQVAAAATQDTAPRLQPVAQPVAPPVADTRPAAPTPAPAVDTPHTREGDMISPGTDGLTAAHITHQAIPTYPPLARAQRVEGTVLVNVLVSETGQVLDTKVLSGVNRPVGINEAALQAARRSSFAPGMKDGVRVKSWTTVKVDFRL